ncbi:MULTISPECIES: hypothetical protein [unclassified Microcoleus]|uniref:hypothetical protein n=1 Tax=unclassified Microcoleus TaxID=2642155 RepID=UPI002FD259C3
MTLLKVPAKAECSFVGYVTKENLGGEWIDSYQFRLRRNYEDTAVPFPYRDRL